jgi:hypothetical protein
VFQPRSDSPLSKGAEKDGKDKAAESKGDKAAPKSPPKDKAPVTLKSADEMK